METEIPTPVPPGTSPAQPPPAPTPTAAPFTTPLPDTTTPAPVTLPPTTPAPTQVAPLTDLPVFDARHLIPPVVKGRDGASMMELFLILESELGEVAVFEDPARAPADRVFPSTRVFVPFPQMLPKVELEGKKMVLVNKALLDATKLQSQGSLEIPYGMYGSLFNPDQYAPTTESMGASRMTEQSLAQIGDFTLTFENTMIILAAVFFASFLSCRRNKKAPGSGMY